MTPCILTVDVIVMHESMLVQSSHEPSLELISSYITKWGTHNSYGSMNRNVWKVQMIESTTCGGVMDSIAIGTYNPALLLAFIEGVLGYPLPVVYTNSSN